MKPAIGWVGAYAHPRTATLLDAGTGPANPSRHARRSALAVCPPAVALRAAPGGGARSAVAGPELCRRRADHHGEEKQRQQGTNKRQPRIKRVRFTGSYSKVQ